LLGARYLPAGLPGGATDTATTALLIPPDLAAGNYYFAAIADWHNRIAEVQENNNTFTIGPLTVTIGPDLVETAVDIPQMVATGVPVNVTDTLLNSGTGNAFTFTIDYFLSTNPVVTSSDLRVGGRSVEFL